VFAEHPNVLEGLLDNQTILGQNKCSRSIFWASKCPRRFAFGISKQNKTFTIPDYCYELMPDCGKLHSCFPRECCFVKAVDSGGRAHWFVQGPDTPWVLLELRVEEALIRYLEWWLGTLATGKFYSHVNLSPVIFYQYSWLCKMSSLRVNAKFPDWVRPTANLASNMD